MRNNEKILWIIDPGHGGIDPITGEYTTKNAKQYHFTTGESIYEGEVNRNVANRLRLYLDGMGLPYEFTVYNSEDMSLIQRVKRANAIYDKAKEHGKTAVLLSIHSNSASATLNGTGTTANGFEIYTSKGQTKSDEYAEIFAHVYQQSFPSLRFRTDKTDGDLDKEADFYVLRETKGPSILFENLFFDNIAEAKLLLKSTFIDSIAAAIAKGCNIIART